MKELIESYYYYLHQKDGDSSMTYGRITGLISLYVLDVLITIASFLYPTFLRSSSFAKLVREDIIWSYFIIPLIFDIGYRLYFNKESKRRIRQEWDEKDVDTLKKNIRKVRVMWLVGLVGLILSILLLSWRSRLN